MICGGFVVFVGEFEGPHLLLCKVASSTELMLDGDAKLAIFLDHFFNVSGESVVGFDLLPHQPVLFKVAIEHLPEMMLLNFWFLLLH